MGLFGAIKNKLMDTITLDESQKGLVVRYRLKNDNLKINQEVVVEEGFEVITCYYDNVCDALTAGKYKFNDVHMPKLYKNVKAKKTKKGYATPKSIPADVYFVNKAPFAGVSFKTPFKLKAKYEDKIVKVKVAGEFCVTVADSHKFMTAMLMDYSIINSEQAKKEIGAYVAYAILGHTKKNIYTIEEFNNNSDSLLTKLNEVVEKELKSIGLTITDLKITELIPPVGVENLEPVKKKDKTLDDIFNTVYGENKGEKAEGDDKTEVFVASGGEAQMTNSNVINLGFGGFSGGVNTENNTQNKEERNTTLDEYEKASKSFNEDLAAKRQQNLVFLNGEKKELPHIPTESEQKKEDIMLGRGAIGTVEALGPVDIADDFVQKNRRIELEALKKSLEEPEKEIKRPKVMKPGKEATVEKTCKSCGAKYTIKDKFCPKCGKSTLNVRYCKACGDQNENDALLCKTCGSRL